MFDRNQYFREYQKRVWVQRRQAWFLENGPCRSCGSWDNLELDHIDPSTKISNTIWRWSLERRLAELAKCQALCKACHKEKTKADVRKMFIREPPHGTNARYRYRRNPCRCDTCREAMLVQQRERRARNGKTSTYYNHRKKYLSLAQPD